MNKYDAPYTPESPSMTITGELHQFLDQVDSLCIRAVAVSETLIGARPVSPSAPEMKLAGGNGSLSDLVTRAQALRERISTAEHSLTRLSNEV